MKPHLCIAILLLTCGCASIPRPVSDPVSSDDLVMPDEACFRQWDPIVQEWLLEQGGLAGSIPAIHKSVLQDRSTGFSRVIRSVWRRQESQAPGSSPGDQMALSRYFSEAVSDELGESVTGQCRSPIWVKPLLLETPGAFSPGAKGRLLQEAPEEARIDDRAFANWLTREILLRPAGIEPH